MPFHFPFPDMFTLGTLKEFTSQLLYYEMCIILIPSFIAYMNISLKGSSIFTEEPEVNSEMFVSYVQAFIPMNIYNKSKALVSLKLATVGACKSERSRAFIYTMPFHLKTFNQNSLGMFQISEEKHRLRIGTETIVPAAFVSFKSRRGAAVCAQTEQSRDPTEWLTEWAAEPRDIYYDNLALPYVDLKIRRIIVAAAYFFFTFFFMIPIAFVQSLVNIEGIEKAFPS